VIATLVRAEERVERISSASLRPGRSLQRTGKATFIPIWRWEARRIRGTAEDRHGMEPCRNRAAWARLRSSAAAGCRVHCVRRARILGILGENGMEDLVFAAATIVFFIGAIGYVYFCERVK
jgi:hypothetical protein